MALIDPSSSSAASPRTASGKRALVRVRPVHHQQVDVVHAEPLATGLVRPPDAVDAVPLPVELGRDEDLGPVDPGIPDALADAVLVAVVLGGVDEPVAGLDGGTDRRRGVGPRSGQVPRPRTGMVAPCTRVRVGASVVVTVLDCSAVLPTPCRREVLSPAGRSPVVVSDHQPVDDQRSKSPVPLGGVRPGRVQLEPRARHIARPQHGQQCAPALPIGAFIRLPSPRALHAGSPCPTPGAAVLDRAAFAGGRTGRADQRAQLHRRDRPAGRPGRRRWQELGGQRVLGHRRGGRRNATPEATRASTRRTLVSSTTWRCPYAKGRWPLPYTSRRPAAPADPPDRWAPGRRGLGDGLGRSVQPQRPARVAQSAPGANRVARGCGRQVGRGGPAGDPLPPRLQHARHRGLLEHELADHDLPGTDAWPSPGQVASMDVVPPQHPFDRLTAIVGRHAGHRTRTRPAARRVDPVGPAPAP